MNSPAIDLPAASWNSAVVPEAEYAEISRALSSDDSPVGIDAKHTHVLILHALERIERRIAAIERRMGTDPSSRGSVGP